MESVDCVISNCVLNLAPDKPAVFREILRVLKPGGRLAISDIALKQPLPDALKQSMAAYSGCIAGALPLETYRTGLLAAGFQHVEIIDSGKDLNAYTKIENQAGCCSPAMQSNSPFPLAQSSCCGSSEEASTVHDDLKSLLERYNVNEYAASVRVFAIKPGNKTIL